MEIRYRTAKSLFPEGLKQFKRIFQYRPNIQIIRHGRFIFLCPTRVLMQFAEDLIFSLPQDDRLNRGDEIKIYVGAHGKFGRYWLLGGRKLAIQTEHIFDQTGKRMWASDFPDLSVNIDQALMFSHGMIDLNPGNMCYYERNFSKRKRRKIIFGPYVFPERKIPYCPSDDMSEPSHLFFGAMGGKESRRSKILSDVGRSRAVSIANPPLFGAALSEEIRKHSAILNIHYESGIYAEAPRLLTAYIHGKPIVSEPLGGEFVEAKHFLPLKKNITEDYEATFNSFSDLVTSRYALRSALDKMGFS